MARTAFMFPGQGSQAPGMGKSLYDASPEAQAVFKTASAVLGFSMEELCFNAAPEELKKTENAQPALLTVSMAALAALRARGFDSDAFAGHSLGEYSALVGAGKLSLEDGLRLVRKRGLLMAAADPDGRGGMAAVIGLAKEELMPVLEAASKTGKVEAANFNCPGQIVISGEKSGIDAAEPLAVEAGAGNYVKLEVSGPFHSSFMKPAADKFAAELAPITIHPGTGRVVANVTASWAADGEIKTLLERQIYSSVLWEDSILFLKNHGYDTFVELGSGKVLRGLMRRIDKGLAALNIEDIDSLEATVGKLA